MWKLVIEDDEGKRTVVPLTRSEYTIGRREGSSIRLTERNVSRGHARLYRKEPPAPGQGPGGSAKLILEDMTSYNGVHVNGLRVTHAQPLEHGDLVQIGDYRIVLQDDTLGESLPLSTGDPTDPGAGREARASTLLDRPNRLVMLQGPTPGTEYPLDVDRLTIGRADDTGISVNHNSVSRLHCEIHALGDSRFEIVDKGSSNGVRVNGGELQRGFIEPGDTIELGDVRFRFVGKGQVFRPESIRLSVIPNRTVEKRSRPPLANVLPVAVFAFVGVSGALGAWAYTRPKPRAPTSAVAPSAEETLLREAKRFCTSDECEAAHSRVESEIPEASLWRDSQDFKDIENQWAKVILGRAEREPDGAAKRALYQRVAQTVSVDAQRRKLAADRLQDLDSSGRTVAADPMDLPSAAPKARLDELASRVEPARKPAAAPEPVAPAAVASPSAQTTAASVDDRERQLALVGTQDAKVQLRQQLEPRVYGGHATEAEVRLLISTCKDLSDKACVQQARAILKRTAAAPQ